MGITISGATGIDMGDKPISNVSIIDSGSVVDKAYVDDLKTIATGTANFTASSNTIGLTGIGVGVEVGDVISISGSTISKNNQDFTIEVIIDANNIIVNQAHAGNTNNTKCLSTVSGNTEVVVKLLSKHYNASEGLGQGWVNVTTSRVAGTTYPNNTNRTISVSISGTGNPSSNLELLINGNVAKKSHCYEAGTTSNAFIDSKITKSDSYRINAVAGSILYFFELR